MIRRKIDQINRINNVRKSERVKREKRERKKGGIPPDGFEAAGNKHGTAERERERNGGWANEVLINGRL